MTRHVPVLLEEVMELLDVRPNKNYVDATLGGGGYTEELLARSAPYGTVLAIDADEDALARTRSRFGPRSAIRERPRKESSTLRGRRKPSTRSRSERAPRLILFCGNFRDIEHIAHTHGVGAVSGVVFDLGLSSDLLERSGRGFSFRKDEPLIMNYESSPLPAPDVGEERSDGRTSGAGLTAEKVVNTYSAQELERVLREYGEVRNARQIARSIIAPRPLKTTLDLVGAARSAGVRSGRELSKIFQALRIEVNDELAALNEGLRGAWELVHPGGRVVVVSYHSLEDRIVKEEFKAKSREYGAEILTKKPATPSRGEIKKNPRARSAKLRAVKKQ